MTNNLEIFATIPEYRIEFVEDRLEIKLFIEIHLFLKISFLSNFFFSRTKSSVQKLFPQSSASPIEASPLPPPRRRINLFTSRACSFQTEVEWKQPSSDCQEGKKEV